MRDRDSPEQENKGKIFMKEEKNHTQNAKKTMKANQTQVSELSDRAIRYMYLCYYYNLLF